MTAAAVIVAAGRGERMGMPEKVLLPLAGVPALMHSIRAAEAAASIDRLVIVAGEHTLAAIEQLVGAAGTVKSVQIVTGGSRRQDSVRNGVLAARESGAAFVAVHDAARPLVRPELFDTTIAAAQERGGAIAAIPVADSLKRADQGVVAASVSRDFLWAAQTPQAFRIERLLEAFDQAERDSLDVTDESGLFEALGWPVAIVMGDAENMKLTRPTDLPILEALLAARRVLSKS